MTAWRVGAVVVALFLVVWISFALWALRDSECRRYELVAYVVTVEADRDEAEQRLAILRMDRDRLQWAVDHPAPCPPVEAKTQARRPVPQFERSSQFRAGAGR